MLAVQRRPAAGRAASMVGVYDDRLSVAAGKPRPDRAAKLQPGRSASGLSELPGDPDRPANHRRRAQAVAPDHGDYTDAAFYHVGISARPSDRDRRAAVGLRAAA